jgi:hypothetical protein
MDNGVVVMGQTIDDNDDFTEKQQDWDESDVGKRIIKRVTINGTYLNELIVQVFCRFCGAEFIGPSREAGGFLGGHECLHSWEIAQEMNREDGLTE